MGQDRLIQGLGPLGVQLPPKLGQIDPKKVAEAEARAIKAAQEQPAYKRFAMGLLGLGVPRQEGEPVNWGNAAGALGEIAGIAPEGIAKAGLPFAAYIPKLMGGKLFHGTPRLKEVVEQGFDPSLYNKHDVLGSYTHLAEEPSYAERYANKGSGARGILPAKVEANNVLDLMNLPKEDRRKIADALPGWEGGSFLETTEPNTLASLMGAIGPEKLKGLGFDAVRYLDEGRISWAVPDPEQIIGAYTNQPIGKVKSGYSPNYKHPSEVSSNPAWQKITDVPNKNSGVYNQYGGSWVTVDQKGRVQGVYKTHDDAKYAASKSLSPTNWEQVSTTHTPYGLSSGMNLDFSQWAGDDLVRPSNKVSSVSQKDALNKFEGKGDSGIHEWGKKHNISSYVRDYESGKLQGKYVAFPTSGPITELVSFDKIQDVIDFLGDAKYSDWDYGKVGKNDFASPENLKLK